MKNPSPPRAHRILSLVLVLATLLSFIVIPASATIEPTPSEGDGITVSDSVLELNSVQELTAKLTVPTADIEGDALTWAKGLEWSLTRTEDMFVQDSEIYPHVYTGDKLENWQIWDSANGKYGEGIENSPWFYFSTASGSKVKTTAEAVSVDTDGSNTVITLRFGTNPFFGVIGFTDYNGKGIRNVFNSFNGTYTFAAKQGDEVVGSAPLDVEVYRSYRRYNEVYSELLAIQKAAEASGRYFEIVEYGKSEGGYSQYAVVFSDSKQSVENFHTMNATATTDPQSLIDRINSGKLTDYRVPFMVNNQHSDEYPNMDAELNLLWELATEDSITYQTLTGLKNGKKMDKYWAPALNEFDITGLGNPRLDIKADGTEANNDGTQGASDIYTISGDITYAVDDLLDELILVFSLAENPDGRTYGSRRNINGFDHNRDTTFQTQAETRNIAKLISSWNPIVFLELHGYMEEFLIEPCSPPHEPNLEYDILVEHFFEGGEAFGMAALATIDDEGYDYKFSQYTLPLRDNFNSSEFPDRWDAWDDLSTNYTPSYAMLNCNAAGYTSETPKANEASTRLFECGMYGMLDYYRQHKEEVYLRQLEFFRRGIENEDASESIGRWYVDVDDKQIPTTDMRPLYEDNGKFFAEYWVIPVDAEQQRDVASAYDMAEFLVRNDVKVSKLTADVTVNGVTYKAGSFVVDMHQAKRNYANCVLYNGVDASSSGFVSLYSDAVTSYPEQWGFDAIPVAVEGAFAGKLEAVSSVKSASAFTGVTGKAVVVSNESIDSVNAVNDLLAANRAVGMVVSGAYKGDFVMGYNDFLTVRDKYSLSATGVESMPDARQLSQPTLYIVGLFEDFHDAKITSGYYADWFSEGYGSTKYDSMHRNGNAMQDLFVYTKQMNFKITDDPDKADVIIGTAALSNNPETEKDVLAAVKSGTPYISTGMAPISYIAENLLNNHGFEPAYPDGDMLHYVTYPDDSLITANHVADEDNVIYAVDAVSIGGKILENDNTTILIQCEDGEVGDYMISGCSPDAIQMSGQVEAIAYNDGKLDLTIFGNSITNKAFQRDEYTYATNAIYTKVMADAPMALPNVDGGNSFEDVPANHWAADSIRYMVDQGLFKGTSATTFAPALSVDRAMLVTVLHRMAGTPAASAPTFADVPTDTWYTDAVGWAVQEKITSGTGNGFAPTANVTREQIAVFLYNYAKFKGMDTTGNALTDFADAASVHTWASEAMGWAVKNSLITGKTGNLLDPTGAASRAEVATILARFLQK